MKSYIFLTDEGYTFQPDSQSDMPDVENLQVIGVAKGKSQEETFRNLVRDNTWIKETNFREVFCYQLDNDFEKSIRHFYLKE